MTISYLFLENRMVDVREVLPDVEFETVLCPFWVVTKDFSDATKCCMCSTFRDCRVCVGGKPSHERFFKLKHDCPMDDSVWIVGKFRDESFFPRIINPLFSIR